MKTTQTDLEGSVDDQEGSVLRKRVLTPSTAPSSSEKFL